MGLLSKARDLLRQAYGTKAEFRPGQWEAIEALLNHQRVLVVQRTGWGKSLVYFIAARLLRDQGTGPTVIISPLLALMRNQMEAAQKMGLKPRSINSTNSDHWNEIDAELRADCVDLLLVSPEQVGTEHFAHEVLPSIRGSIGSLVVDEAHCISDWGHDFRPDYRRIIRVVQQLPANVPLLGTTATANERVVKDVVSQLGPGLIVQRGSLVRESLILQTITLSDQSERLAWLAQHLPALPGSGIIYCLTKADCDRVSMWLRDKGIDAPAYYSGVIGREALEERLIRNQVKALVATTALSMGFDKPDLGFVVHYQRPGSIVAYYQQIGRAGRALNRAYAILLNGKEDDEIQEYFINTAFPAEEDTRAVARVLEQGSGSRINDIMHFVNLSEGKVRRVLQLLEVDGMVGKEGSKYFRTPRTLEINRPRQEQITSLRRHELDRMRTLVSHQGCLMQYIARELDDHHASRCGHCASCSGDPFPRTVEPGLVRSAVSFLKRDHKSIEPRKMWPAGGHAGRHGAILANQQIERGYALCMWGDAGWGRIVHKGKYQDDHFSDELVEATARMICGEWNPKPFPEWVTAVPSLRRPRLVPSFANRLADRIGIPFLAIVQRVSDTQPQKAMQNSTLQARNALSSFGIFRQCPTGPVLLVDDIVDSRWTLTVCGALLREAGSGPVYPVTLAMATAGGDDR